MSETVKDCCPECGRPKLGTWYEVGAEPGAEFSIRRAGGTGPRFNFYGHVQRQSAPGRAEPSYWLCWVTIYGPTGGLSLQTARHARPELDTAKLCVETMLDDLARDWFGLQRSRREVEPGGETP